jgi:hypothetical protein
VKGTCDNSERKHENKADAEKTSQDNKVNEADEEKASHKTTGVVMSMWVYVLLVSGCAMNILLLILGGLAVSGRCGIVVVRCKGSGSGNADSPALALEMTDTLEMSQNPMQTKKSDRRRRTEQNELQKMASIRHIDNRPRHHPMEQNKVKKEFGQRMSPLETLEEAVEDFEVEMHNVAVKSQTFEAGELVPGATKSPSTSVVKAEQKKGLHKKTKSFRKHTDGQGRTYFESMDEETRGATVWNLPEDGFVVI